MEPTAAPSRPSLADLERELAPVSGLDLRRDAPLARLTTLGIGGAAELLAAVSTQGALLRLVPVVERRGLPFLLVGQGSNLLLPDEGVDGVVVRLVGGFRRVRWLDGDRVAAGGGVSLPKLARVTCDRGLSGLEPLAGFPSTVGGAVVMNAGCYGTEIRELLERVTVVERDGRLRRLAVDELEPGYRSTVLQSSGAIVARAWFRLTPGDPERSRERIRELAERRWSSLPRGHGNAGSIFRNPPGDAAGRLIDACGLKGERRGGAQISEKHANVIVNLGGARAAEVLELMAEAWRRVRERFGVELEPEVVLAGGLRERWRAMIRG